MDYDRFSRNDVIGVIILGENSDHMTGQTHWIDMLQSPQHETLKNMGRPGYEAIGGCNSETSACIAG